MNRISSSLMQGKVSIFIGNTGVGKSTLLNRLFPDLDLRTAAISNKLGRGRHTTRQVELYPIPGGGYVADSPGFSTVELEQYEPIRKEAAAILLPGVCAFSGQVPVCRLLAPAGAGVRCGDRLWRTG